MKAGPDRRYTPEFRDSAVKQVIEGGRSVAAVARSLEMSNKSLANWVYRARKGQELVKLSTECQHLTNVLKMIAYQMESDLVELIRPHYKRVEDEGRTLVQSALQDAADIEPTDDQLRLTLAPLSSPHRSRVLETLCEALNKTNTLFPGTQLQMRYSVAPTCSET